MGLMDKFSDPSLFDPLSFGDKMAGSAITMLMGMGITFVVLMLLWGVFALMGKCMSSTAKKGDKASAAETKANATPSVAAPAAAKTDDVLTAVIAAAIAAYQSEGRKIQRLSGETTLWTNAAREDCIESRRF